MTQGQRINVTQVQRLQLNLGLQASIRMLRADAAGLTRYLEEQAAENPHLRLDPALPPAAGDWLPRWSGVLSSGLAVDLADSPAPSLMVHVTAEIGRLLRPGRERQIAFALAEALEPSGWLGRTLLAIAAEAGASVPETESVLTKIQKMEPTGLFARNLAECLRLQATEADQLDPVLDVMLDNLPLLASGDFGRLARLARCSEAEIATRFRLIRSFNPKPGASFANLAAPMQREPDLLVKQSGGGWEISLNRSALPTLRVEASPEGGSEALTAAKALQRMVAARNSTLLRVGQEILRLQMRAFAEGPGALVPMTMAEVAEALDLHQSTISRVVAGVSIDTPRGTWWLRSMFSTAAAKGEDGVAAAALRDRLARLVAAEPATAPLSDAALATALAQGGAEIARRTVAKYRAMLNIPAAHRRKRKKALAGSNRRSAALGTRD